MPRRMISSACANVGVLESGLTVEPCPTITSALFGFEIIGENSTGASREVERFCDETKPLILAQLPLEPALDAPRVRRFISQPFSKMSLSLRSVFSLCFGLVTVFLMGGCAEDPRFDLRTAYLGD